TLAVTVHRLVQAVARARSEANGSVQDAVGRLIAQLGAIFPKAADADPRSWPLCAHLTPHLLALVSPDDTSVAELLDRADRYFTGRGAYSQAAAAALDALAIREKMLGPSSSTLQRPSTTSPSCLWPRVTLREHGRSTSARWPYERRC